MPIPEQMGKPQEAILGLGTREDLEAQPKAIGTEQIQRAIRTLEQYKRGKTNLETKVIQNEQFWKLRHWEQMKDKKNSYTPATAWLWNVITSKHADMVEAFPEPNVLPRESGDDKEAEVLSSIIPVILEQNNFRDVWSECCKEKLTQGTTIYGVFWNGNKLNGLGDIEIKRINQLCFYTESGVTNLQDSENVFYTELVNNDQLIARYPELDGKLGNGRDQYVAKFLYDDAIDTTEKSTVVDWYYKKNVNGKTVLHYVKFCNDTVLYATENETVPPTKPVIDPATGQQSFNPQTGHVISEPVGESMAQTGLYAHGMYPFFADGLYQIEGSLWSYGLTDICRDTQISIDQLNAAIVKNALMASKRRFFVTDGTDVNVKDFADWEKDFVSVSSNMSEETLREINVSELSSIYVEILNNQIEMLKETSGNRDVSNGGTVSGVTSASGIAALQESSGKTSKLAISGSYTVYKNIVLMVIELIRQFYDLPRQFRIVGEQESQEFLSYDNSGIKPQEQGTDFGTDMGFRVPLFDVDVTAQKATDYNKTAQNDLAIQFYNLQFFDPQNVDQALACLEMMDFRGKQDVVSRIQKNGTLLQTLTEVFKLAVGLAQTFDPSVIPQLMQMGVGAGVIDPQMAAQTTMQSQAHSNNPKAISSQQLTETDADGNVKPEEHPFVERARARAQEASQPNA